MEKPKKRSGPKPKDPNNVKSRSHLKPDDSPQPNVPKHILEDDEARAKLDEYEKIVNNRKFCKLCKKYRKRVPTGCKTEKDVYTCIREHGYEGILRRKRKPKSEHKTVCKYCKKDFGDYKRMIGHINSCEFNPNESERRRKIAEYRKGKKHSDETKNKIAMSMVKFHQLKTREGIYTARKVHVKGGKNLTIKFF
jgi:hypothetical protein